MNQALLGMYQSGMAGMKMPKAIIDLTGPSTASEMYYLAMKAYRLGLLRRQLTYPRDDPEVWNWWEHCKDWWRVRQDEVAMLGDDVVMAIRRRWEKKP